jgi:hypothetical protein
MKYQTYFRIRRGGIGIPYELAKTEFTAVFEPFGLKIDRDYPERRRMWVDLDLLPDRVAVLASNLGYTEAIMHQKIEPYRGETLAPIERGRWYIGWIRQWEWKVYQTEVYVQDAKSLLNEAPDQRGFQIERDGEKQFVTGGHHVQRAVSALDARFLFNIAKLTPEMRILDPFAGCGGIVSEAKRRGLPIFAADIDASLSPGLAALAPKRYFIGDARTLPFSTACFDAIITEPPFRTQYRQAVMDALPELHRVLKPTGKIILLIAMDMLEDVQCFFEGVGKRVECVGVIPRGGGLKCPVLDAQK